MKASVSLLSKISLFETRRQYVAACILLSLLFTFSLFIEYRKFQALTQFDDYITRAWVEKQYIKNGHWVLKLQASEGFSFYTTSREDLKEIEGDFVEVRLFTDKIDFISFLKGFYARSVILSRFSEKQKRYSLMRKLEAIHDIQTGPLFNALFFSGPIPASTRDILSAWGINHLLAISGFHLGVLSFILFYILKSLYKPLQRIFFPYRHGNRDITIIVLALLFAYVFFLDFTPSLLRAFSMTIFAYVLYDRGIKIVSFSSLFLVVAFLIALWPGLTFSLGFWFSVGGVFYIFLFLHHMKELRLWQSFILLHFWVYTAMLPFVHYFYGSFSLHQLFSPLLSMLFILFYPLELFLHLIGKGASADFLLHYLLTQKMHVIQLFTPLWVFLLYLLLSFLAVFSRRQFYLLGLFAFSFMGYFFYRVTQL